MVFDTAEEYQGVPAADLYRSFTGYRPFPGGAVYVGLSKLLQTNEQQYWPNIGLLGRILHRQGLHTAAIGNADADLYNRAAALILMDQKGRIDFSAVGEGALEVDRRFPFGFRSDLGYIWDKWLQMKDQAAVILISLGDLERLERYRVYLSAAQVALYRRKVLTAYDHFLGRLLPEIQSDTTLTALLTVASPADDQTGNPRLNPLVLYGPGFQRGRLFSAATRRPGIITAFDLPLTILHFLGITRSAYPGGRPLHTVSGDWSGLKRLEQQLAANYQCRWVILPVYGYCLIGIILLLILTLIFWPGQLWLFRLLVSAYLFGLTFPAVFMAEALFNPLTWEAMIGMTLSMAALFFGCAWLLAKGNPFRMLSIISFVTLFVLIGDGLTNGHAELFSFLGYSAVSGARYYGIGNEYMGFLLGAYIIGITFNLQRLSDRLRGPLLWIAAYALALLLAHPGLGANIGGGITAIVGLSITNYLWLEHPVRGREIVRLILAVLILLSIVGLWDFLISGPTMTHFGKFIGAIRQQGFSAFINTLSHKWNLNWQLIGSTPWTIALLLILLGAPFLYHRAPAPVARLLHKHPVAMRGFLGLTLTALIGLLVNDSGIVTVTTLFIFGLFELFLVILKEWGFIKPA